MLKIGLDSVGVTMPVAVPSILSKTIGTMMNICQSIENVTVMDIMSEVSAMKMMTGEKGVVEIAAEEEISCLF